MLVLVCTKDVVLPHFWKALRLSRQSVHAFVTVKRRIECPSKCAYCHAKYSNVAQIELANVLCRVDRDETGMAFLKEELR